MLVVCGEAVIDLISDGSATGYQARPGGSPVNVAVGSARLGVPTSLLARLGTGRFARLLRAHLADSGVDLSISVNAAEPATLAVVGLDAAGAASYDFYVDGTADWGWQRSELPDPLPAGVRALHVGSIASWREPAAGLIAELVVRERRRGGVLISFDPNLRPSLIEDSSTVRSRVEALVGSVHLVKVSAEDLDWLYPRDDPDRAARRWARAGPSLVVLTDGARGACAYRPGRPAYARRAHAVNVVDTVGAGDGFTAGLLAVLADLDLLDPRGLNDLDDGALDTVLVGAELVAALTCTRAGADPSNRAERDAVLAASAPPVAPVVVS